LTGTKYLTMNPSSMLLDPLDFTSNATNPAFNEFKLYCDPPAYCFNILVPSEH